MYLKMLTTLGTSRGPMKRGEVWEIEDENAQTWIDRGLAVESDQPPTMVVELMNRLQEGAGKPCIFEPFVGEFGHEVMSHIRMVHFHEAGEKVVACRPGNEVLYPSAAAHVTDWTDPIDDADRVGTIRDRRIQWLDLAQRYPEHTRIRAGALTMDQEKVIIGKGRGIPFRPRQRGLKASVVLGVRRRAFAPEKNWQHWQQVADALTAAGVTFAVIGARETSHHLLGEVCHSGDLDTDAAIELLQGCGLYVGTDSGNSHLASTVGCRMLVFREPFNGMRDFLPRMAEMNPGQVEVLEDGWLNPAKVIERILAIVTAPVAAPQAAVTSPQPSPVTQRAKRGRR